MNSSNEHSLRKGVSKAQKNTNEHEIYYNGVAINLRIMYYAISTYSRLDHSALASYIS